MGKVLDEHFKETWTSMSYQDLEKFSGKFAELIVQECASIVTDAVDQRAPASTYADKIKEHFGV